MYGRLAEWMDGRTEGRRDGKMIVRLDVWRAGGQRARVLAGWFADRVDGTMNMIFVRVMQGIMKLKCYLQKRN